MKFKWGFREVWVTSLVVKLILATLMPLSLDESYYWVWGQHPQLSYFDHPPMVGWLFFLGRAFEFLGGSSGRIPGVILGHATFLIWNETLKPYLSEPNRSLWFLFLLFSPLIGWGGLIQTPDVSFVFFWSVSILAFLRAVEFRTLNWYLLLGASLGLGFCSKYPTVLFVPSILLYLLVQRRLKDIRWNYVFGTIVVGLIFCAPVLIWNASHDWASFKFQIHHGLNSENSSSLWLFQYLGAQILILFPTVVIFFFRAKVPANLKSLYYFALFPIAFFGFSSLKARVEPNWPIAAYPAFLTVSFFALKNSRWFLLTVAIWVSCFALVLVEAFSPFLPIAPGNNKIHELRKFDSLIPAVQNLEPLYASSYQIASALSFRLKRDIPKLQGMNRVDFYDFFPPARAKDDKFFLILEGPISLPAWVSQAGYEVTQSTPINESIRVLEVRKRAKAPNS